MRVCLVTSKLNFTTAGASVTEMDLLARTLQDFGHEVTVVTPFSQLNDRPLNVAYPVFEEQIKSKRLLGIQWGVFKILRKYTAQADFFHVDGHIFLYGAGLYRFLGGKTPIMGFFNRELTSWPLNTSNLFVTKPDNFLKRTKQAVRRFIEKTFLIPLANRIDVLNFTNPHLQQSYTNFGLRSTPLTLIVGDPFDYVSLMNKYGVTEDHYSNRNKQSGPIRLFYSSRMAPGKGFDLLIAAFAKLSNKENFKLILGGSGPEEDTIKALISELKLQSHVELLGWMTKDGLYNQLKQADIFVQARWRRDMTSYSLLDAMAFGLPCILPGRGGMEWDAKEAALYFADESVDDLAKKIAELGASPELRATLSRNCYKRLRSDELDNVTQARRMETAMKEVVCQK